MTPFQCWVRGIDRRTAEDPCAWAIMSTKEKKLIRIIKEVIL